MPNTSKCPAYQKGKICEYGSNPSRPVVMVCGDEACLWEVGIVASTMLDNKAVKAGDLDLSAERRITIEEARPAEKMKTANKRTPKHCDNCYARYIPAKDRWVCYMVIEGMATSCDDCSEWLETPIEEWR